MPQPAEAEHDGQPKWCTHCGIQKPLGDFHRDITSPDGHRNVCKACRSKINEENREAEIDPRIQEVHEDLAEAIGTMKAGGTCSPHYAEIGEALMRRCGGVEGFARLYMAHLHMTKWGSSERGKCLRDILSLHIKLSESTNERLEVLTDEDLTRIMGSAIRDYQQKLSLPPDALPTVDARVVSTAKKAPQ